MKVRLYIPVLTLFACLLLTNCGKSINAVAEKPDNDKIDSTLLVIKKPVLDSVQIKYGKILGVDPQEISNIELYKFVDSWLNVPYKMGGEGRNGIDCSAFAQYLYVDGYSFRIERTANRMAEAKSTHSFLGQEYLKEGDLLFFKKPNSRDRTITHVGVYLQNNMFVSASGYAGPEKFTGVKISDLSDSWWQERFVKAGRKPLPIYVTE